METFKNRADPLCFLIDDLPAAVAMFDREMRYLAASKRWIEDYGLTAPLTGRSHYDLFPEIPDHWKEIHRRALKGESFAAEDERFQRLDKTDQYLSWTVQPWRDDGDKIGGIIIATEDVTKRKLSHEALKESEERFRALVFATSQVLWTAGPDGLFIREKVHPSWLQFTGQTIEQAVGWGWLDAIHPDDRARIEPIWRRAVDTKKLYVVDYRVRRCDGEYRWMTAKGAPLLDPDGSVREWIGANSDITEREFALQALNEAHRRKDEFLATLGHELRTPLATIQLAMDVIENDPTIKKKFHTLFSRMQRQVRHLTRVVEDIFQVSRMTCGQFDLRKEKRDLNEMVALIEDSHRAQFEKKGIKLNVTLADKALPISCDNVRFTQALGNLLDNAAKYTHPGGTVDLTVSRQADEALVRVRDTGIGVRPEQIKWIFGLFNQMKNGSDRAQEGIGIGLALARKLIELHDGTIEAKSEGLGRGSEFMVRLPLANPETAAGKTSKANG